MPEFEMKTSRLSRTDSRNSKVGESGIIERIRIEQDTRKGSEATCFESRNEIRKAVIPTM